MTANNPAYAKKLLRNKNTLTDQQYLDLLSLIETLHKEMILDTDGRIVTTNSGEIVYREI